MDNRTMQDQEMGHNNAVANMVSRANERSFKEAQKLLEDSLAYLPSGVTVLYLEKPKTQSRFEISEGSMVDDIKHKIVYTNNPKFKEFIGNEVVLKAMPMIGFLKSSDLATVEDFSIGAILK